MWCGSTESYIEPTEAHQSLKAFEKAMRENDEMIAPSMMYAYASLMEGVPFANGAPNLTVDLPVMLELSRKNEAPICGKDFKTGQTLMKTVLAPAFKARLLGLSGWYSTNILGNRDGEVLDDPGSFKTKEESKLGVLEHILQPGLVSRTLREYVPQGSHQLLPAPRRQQRRMGQHRHLRMARLSHADQGGLPLPRFDSCGADRARSGAVSGPGEALLQSCGAWASRNG